jgi:hypothetical protein
LIFEPRYLTVWAVRVLIYRLCFDAVEGSLEVGAAPSARLIGALLCDQ